MTLHKKNIKATTGISCIVALFIVTGLLYSYYTPLWIPPDEVRHFAYSEYIAQNGALPYLKPGDAKGYITQSVHPPLYYLMMSLFFTDNPSRIQEVVSINDGPGPEIITHPTEESSFPYSGKARTAYLIRFISILLSALTVYLVYVLTLRLFPGEVPLALASAFFTAVLPQFLHISASMSNENLSTALGTLYLVLICNFYNHPVKLRQQIIAGIVLGCCFLTKTSTFLYVPVTAGVFYWGWRKKKDYPFVRPFFSIIIIAVSLSAGWFIRNWFFFNDPFFTQALSKLQPWSVRPLSFSIDFFANLITTSFISFYGYFGSMQFPIKTVHCIAYFILSCVAIFGLLLLLKRKTSPDVQSRALWFLLLNGIFGLLFFASINVKFTMAMGRYFFVILAPISILFCLGIQTTFPPRFKKTALIIFSIICLCLSLDIFTRVVLPSFDKASFQKNFRQQTFCCRTDWLSQGNKISQTFIAPENNLCCIGVLLLCKDHRTDPTIRFSLQEEGAQNPELAHAYKVIKTESNLYTFYFQFPPIQNSKNKTYRVTIKSNAPSHKPIVALMYESDDPYANGEMSFNNARITGDLFFSLYSFTANSHDTFRPRHNRAFITSKRFVEFSELQLYNEMSENFKKKTSTYWKLKLFKKVLADIYQ